MAKRPALVIEAKSLGTRLATGDAIDQGTKYCNRLGIRYFVLTDGSQWEARDKNDPRKPVFKFDVADSRANVIQLLWLWPGNFQGERTRPVPTQELHERPADVALPPRPSTAPSPKPVTNRVPLPNVDPNSIPRRLVFPPNETPKDINGVWMSVQYAIATWLIDNQHVQDLPLRYKHSKDLMHNERKSRTEEVRKGHWIDKTSRKPSN